MLFHLRESTNIPNKISQDLWLPGARVAKTLSVGVKEGVALAWATASHQDCFEISPPKNLSQILCANVFHLVKVHNVREAFL